MLLRHLLSVPRHIHHTLLPRRPFILPIPPPRILTPKPSFRPDKFALYRYISGITAQNKSHDTKVKDQEKQDGTDGQDTVWIPTYSAFNPSAILLIPVSQSGDTEVVELEKIWKDTGKEEDLDLGVREDVFESSVWIAFRRFL